MMVPTLSLSAVTLLLASVLAQSQEQTNPAYSTNDEERHKYNAGRRISLGWVMYDGYAPLDFWGPYQILTGAASNFNITLSMIGKEKGIITNQRKDVPPRPGAISVGVELTHTPEDAPPLDLLMLPGGLGNRGNATDWVVDYVNAHFDSIDYVASVCTGSLFLAKSGVLDHHRATTNKAAWEEIVVHGTNVSWVPNARWTQEGKIWTSSGVAAGMDMTYALLSWIYGSEKINNTMNAIELSPHTNPDWDPYAVVHEVPGANTSRPLKDLVGPVGFDSYVPTAPDS